MSFLNKFKKEFDGLNIGDRLQAAQQGSQQGHGGHGYSQPPPASYEYEHQPPPQNPYPQYPPPEKQPSPHNPYSSYPPPEKQPSPHNPYSNYPPPEKHSAHSPYPSPYPPPQEPYNYGQHGGPNYGTPSPQPHIQSPPPGPPSYPGCQQSPPPAGHPYPHPQHGTSAPGALQVGGAPCPTPPRWVPHWSEHDRRWYYAETSGRSAWEAPGGLPPLAAMPAYSGQGGSRDGPQGHSGYHAAPYVPATTQAPPPGPGPEPGKSKMPSSNTMLAAAGGFAAGGVAGYFTHEVLDKRKKKKRHGRTPADFSDFSEYPAMMVGLDCNICDQAISGPYAHCAKCDRGDYDLCRDCIAQGAMCDGKGKHRMVKVYPKYTCDYCDQLITGDFYHCGVCNRGDWDVCQKCLDRGLTCKADGGHNLAKLYIPVSGLGKHSGGGGGSSSSDSD